MNESRTIEPGTSPFIKFQRGDAAPYVVGFFLIVG